MYRHRGRSTPVRPAEQHQLAPSIHGNSTDSDFNELNHIRLNHRHWADTHTQEQTRKLSKGRLRVWSLFMAGSPAVQRDACARWGWWINSQMRKAIAPTSTKGSQKGNGHTHTHVNAYIYNSASTIRQSPAATTSPRYNLLSSFAYKQPMRSCRPFNPTHSGTHILSKCEKVWVP